MNFDGLLLDGAMGSLLLEKSGVFAPSERFCLTHPQLVEDIHLAYIQAGSDILYTNTFGVNPIKYPTEYQVLIKEALKIARRAVRKGNKPTKIALDIGPTGKLIGQAGITFDQAYNAFVKTIQAAEGEYDIVVLETFTDLNEMRAALLAAKDTTDAPVAVSMSFEAGGRSAFGCSVECFALTATALGADCIGLNCSVGPAEMVYLFEQLHQNTPLPTFVKPNAGMPQIYHSKSIYNVRPEQFAASMAVLRANGAAMVGGCCGTTPAYIAALKQAVATVRPTASDYRYDGKLCSAARAVLPQNGAIIGERINPTGKKRLQEAIRQNDIDFIAAFGPQQEDEGASLLDVNLGLGGLDDSAIMQAVVLRLQAVTTTPLVIDSSNPHAIENGLRYFAGRALVNSVNGEDDSLRTILPLAKRYGAAVIGLTLDKNGIPDTVEERVNIARKIVQQAALYGIAPQDVYIDCLTMAEGARRGAAELTAQCVAAVKQLGCRTVLGISNISYGMPLREDLNAAMLQLCLQAGLDLYIGNPHYRGLRPSKEALLYLTGKITTEAYIAYAADAVQEPLPTADRDSLPTAVRRGDAALVRAHVKAMLAANDDATAALIQALDEVGRLYESGRLFLPQLIAAADAAKVGFDLLYAGTGAPRQNKGTLVLATVKGDVHDIGKNIVKAVVSNYGYRVVDLGKDVDAETILKGVAAEMPCVLGLSALMTTTAANMADIVHMVRQVYPNLPILVGGAVLTPQFAQDIGCIYCKDAAASVREMGKLCAR